MEVKAVMSATEKVSGWLQHSHGADEEGNKTKGERFVSRYIVNAIYCIIWKYRGIALFRKYCDILTIFSVHDIGQILPFMDL